MHTAVQKVYMHLMLRFLSVGDAWDHLGCIVQHNNEPQHSSRVIKDYHQAEKNKQSWNQMVWTPQSPRSQHRGVILGLQKEMGESLDVTANSYGKGKTFPRTVNAYTSCKRLTGLTRVIWTFSCGCCDSPCPVSGSNHGGVFSRRVYSSQTHAWSISSSV